MEMDMVRCAQEEDLERLSAFLEAAGLSSDGIKELTDYFLLMENPTGDIKATLGIEPHGDAGLLRSLAVTADSAEKDLFILFEQILMLARDKQLRSLYLASNKRNSMEFFSLMGFKEESREQLPEALYQSSHVRYILSVDNSYFLKLSL